MRRLIRAFLTVSALCAAVGCALPGQQAADPTAQPTAAELPTAVAAQPTATAAPASTEPPSPAPTEPPSPVPPEATTSPPAAPPGAILQRVRQAGILRCGVNGKLPGFSFRERNGTYSGFDADFCRVVAVAVLGEPDRVDFIELGSEERFEAVRSGRVDVLFRNTTWTAARDNATEKLDFGPTTFHDGQGFMVRQAAGINLLEDLRGRRICVEESTTTALNLEDVFSAQRIDIEIVRLGDIDQNYAAYDSGQCDAITSDRSQLTSRRTGLSNPAEHVILDEIISREPLGPAFAENDSQWKDIVSWSIFATIYAAEIGVSSENVEQSSNSTRGDIRRLLGIDGDIGTQLGLENDFARDIVGSIGNYTEIYARNLGPQTPFNLEPGPNKVWNTPDSAGGVLSSPPFR